MVVVKRKKGESEDRLIARFRKRVIYEKLIPEYREKERYEKPSQKRKKDAYRVKYQIELEKKRNL